MISDREIARGFDGLWNEVLPLLTPHFVRLFNEGYRRDISSDEFGIGTAVPIDPDNDPAVVAEFAFYLADLACQHRVSLGDVSNADGLMREAELKALTLVSKYAQPMFRPRDSISQSERSEGLLLLRNLCNFSRIL